jgi:hypothetical protein
LKSYEVIMPRPEPVEIERLRYWQGQKLRSRDFRDQMEMTAQLRWWHNRALHQAVGVRSGLTVVRVLVAGQFTAVRIACGVAYDCYGRELLLQAVRELRLPNPTNRMTLLIRYKETAPFPSRREVLPECVPCGSAAGLEEADVLWQPAAHGKVTDGVPLAQLRYEPAASLAVLPQEVAFPPVLARKVQYDAERQLLIATGKLSGDEQHRLLQLSTDPAFQQAVTELASTSVRVPVLEASGQRVRPLARPRLGSGTTVPEGTAWELWSEKVFRNRVINTEPLGIQVTIDTSAAGFTETPCYFAWLAGTLWEKSYIEFFPVPFLHLDRESARQFRLRLWLPMLLTLLGARTRLANQNFAEEFINFARQQKLHVCWLGMQPTLRETAECTTMAPSACHPIHKG